jgi:hypothetical protein
MKLEIDIDTAETLVVPVLKEGLESLERDLFRYENDDDDFIAIFSTDSDEDIKMIKKHIKAFKRVINWYAVPGERIE